MSTNLCTAQKLTSLHAALGNVAVADCRQPAVRNLQATPLSEIEQGMLYPRLISTVVWTAELGDP